jgi:N-acetylmuramoyl-L-alanine amidase
MLKGIRTPLVTTAECLSNLLAHTICIPLLNVRSETRILFILTGIISLLYLPKTTGLLETHLFVSELMAAPLNVEVAVRFSENPEGKRIVFEASDEEFIKKTTVSVLKDTIEVRFPSAPVLRYGNRVNLDLSIQGRFLNIRFKEPFKVKTLYLTAPPRISIDVSAVQASQQQSIPKESGAQTPSVPVRRIIIDPGHGGYDSGIVNDSFREKDITLAIAKEMDLALKKKGRSVILTRKADQFIPLSERAMAANQKTPGLFISLHLSLSEGFVINIPYIDSMEEQSDELYGMKSRQRRHIDKSKNLAEAIGKAIREDFKKEVVYREIPLSLLEMIDCPAILIEIPGSSGNDKEGRTRLSQTILKGIEYATK